MKFKSIQPFSYLTIAIQVLQLKPSEARLNLLHHDHVVNDESSDSSTDSNDDGFININELHGSSSSESIQSIIEVSEEKNLSKSNLLMAPAGSFCSIIERGNLCQKNSQCLNMQVGYEKTSRLEMEIGFTREALQKRLQNLVGASIKKFENNNEVTFWVF